jgi:hypothetical protein
VQLIADKAHFLMGKTARNYRLAATAGDGAYIVAGGAVTPSRRYYRYGWRRWHGRHKRRSRRQRLRMD